MALHIKEGHGTSSAKREGIYNVPRSSLAHFGGKFFAGRVRVMEGINNVLRSVHLLDDDYVYPPDALELLEGVASFETSEATLHSHESFSLAMKSSSNSNEQAWRGLGKLPLVFGGAGMQENGAVGFSAGELEEVGRETSRGRGGGLGMM